MVFLALLPVDFLICLFCKTWATETCFICSIWSLYIFVVHWNVYAKFSSFLPHSISGKIWLQFAVCYHYYLYITMGILITRIVSLNIKIMLIQEYLDSALLLLTGLVATVLFWGDPGSFADQYVSDLKEVTLYLSWCRQAYIVPLLWIGT
jgi:hypothetical protein